MTFAPWNVDCIDSFYDEDEDLEDDGWGTQDEEDDNWEAFDDLDEIAP